jgi:hypothetical protein
MVHQGQPVRAGNLMQRQGEAAQSGGTTARKRRRDMGRAMIRRHNFRGTTYIFSSGLCRRSIILTSPFIQTTS